MDMHIVPFSLLFLGLVVQFLVLFLIAGGEDGKALFTQGCVAVIIITFVLTDMAHKGVL